MKFWKHTFVAVAAFLAVGTTVLYTSCEKDGCLELKCLNGGACTDGFCRCPTGYEGPTCNERVVDKFIGSYYGDTRCVQDTTEFPHFIDTVDIFLRDSATLTIVQHSHITDTFYGNTITKDMDLGVATRHIIVPDDTSMVNYSKKITIELDEGKKRLTMYVEETTDVANGVKTDCKFLGFEQ